MDMVDCKKLLSLPPSFSHSPLEDMDFGIWGDFTEIVVTGLNVLLELVWNLIH